MLNVTKGRRLRYNAIQFCAAFYCCPTLPIVRTGPFADSCTLRVYYRKAAIIMPVYNFKQMQAVPTASELIDIVLMRTQRKTPTVIHPGYKITRIRSF
jgi:NOG1 N-terminal helical domain